MRSRFFLLLFVMAGLVVAFAPLPVRPIATQKRNIQIEARQFAYSPSELDVNPGDTVTIQLVSMDVVHGLYIDGTISPLKLIQVNVPVTLFSLPRSRKIF